MPRHSRLALSGAVADQQRGLMPSGVDRLMIVQDAEPAYAGAGGQKVRSVLVAGLIGAILLMIAIAALTTH